MIHTVSPLLTTKRINERRGFVFDREREKDSYIDDGEQTHKLKGGAWATC